MTKEEKIELGKLLDKYRIKAVFYGEQIIEQGVYQVLRYNDNDELVEEKIYGKDLD